MTEFSMASVEYSAGQMIVVGIVADGVQVVEFQIRGRRLGECDREIPRETAI